MRRAVSQSYGTYGNDLQLFWIYCPSGRLPEGSQSCRLVLESQTRYCFHLIITVSFCILIGRTAAVLLQPVLKDTNGVVDVFHLLRCLCHYI